MASATAPALDGPQVAPTMGSKCWNFWAEWFSSGHIEVRSAQQIEREKYIFWHPITGRFQRWMMILPVLIGQMVVGSLYTWSIYNKPADAYWGSTGMNAQGFTCGVGFFGLTTLLFGNWMERMGPFYPCLITTFFTPAGLALAAAGNYKQNYYLMVFGYGIFAGIGAGMTYISTVSALQKHFPEFKGVVSGIAVMGFGVGSFIWTTAGGAMLNNLGFSVWQTQGIFAAAALVLMVLVTPWMRYPQPGWVPDTEHLREEQSVRGTIFRALAVNKKKAVASDKQYTFKEAATSVEFFCLIIMVFGQFITGVVFIGSASDIVINTFGQSASQGDFITSMVALCNFTGRVGWGFASDKMGRKNFYLMSTAAQTFALGLMIPYIQQGLYGPWLLSFLLIASLYGGGFGVLPAFVSDLFGPKISGATHGVFISVWALSAIIGIPIFSSYTSTYSKPGAKPGSKIALPQAYIMNCWWLTWMPLMAFCALLFLNTRPHDRALRHMHGGLRARFFRWVLMFNKKGVACQGPAAQDAEWAAWQAERSQLKKEHPSMHFRGEEVPLEAFHTVDPTIYGATRGGESVADSSRPLVAESSAGAPKPAPAAELELREAAKMEPAAEPSAA